MPLPPRDVFPAIIADLDASLQPHRLQQAHETHRALRPALERARALPLPFVGQVDEPGHALTHVASGDLP